MSGSNLKNSALNLVFNVSGLVLSMALSFWITPFITNSLGSESYGFVPLTQQMVNYMTVITVSITSISGRFFTVAKKQGHMEKAQEYFSSTLFAGIIGSLVMLVPIAAATVFINRFIQVPDYLLFDVRMSFGLFGLVFLVSFISSCFNVAAFSENKIYYTSGINMIYSIIRMFLTVLLCMTLVPRIWYISASTLAAAVVVLVLNVLVFRKLQPSFKISIKNHSKLREMLSSGMWASLSEIGVILFLQIDLLVSNWYVGEKLAGEYAVVLQLPTILRTFSGTIISIFVPVVVSLYAAGKIDDMTKYVNNAIKYVGIVLALPIGAICGLGGTFLALWVGESFRQYQTVLTILTVHLSINLSVQTLTSVQTAMNKLRIPAFVTLIMGTINFILACALAKPLGVLGIALSGSIVLTCKNLVFTPLYIAHITKKPWYSFLPGVVKPLFATAAVWALSWAVQRIVPVYGWISFLAVCCAIGVIYLAFVWLAMINKEEKRQFVNFVGGKLGKCRKSQ